MTQIGILETVQVGTPERHTIPIELDSTGHTWRTSFFRTPDPHPRWLYTTHLEGNDQADKKHHGKPGQAVLLYAASHYPHWQEELNRPEMGPGGFGENFTTTGMMEDDACIGDIYALGEAHIQVSGPRFPCANIERRWGIPGLTARTAETGRTGWYCRTLQEGLIEPGTPILLLERPYPGWTIALVNDFGHKRKKDAELGQKLASCPLLDEWWQARILHAIRK